MTFQTLINRITQYFATQESFKQ